MSKAFIAIILSAALMAGCGNQSPSKAGEHEHANGEAHSHAEGEEHGHEAEGHDHEAEKRGTGCTEDHDETAEAAAHAGEIVFTKAQAERTDFALHQVEPAPFHEVIPTSGRILAAQGDEASVVAPVSGIVSFAGKKLSDGTAVNKGESLFTISSKEIAEGDYTARARAAFEQAKAAYERAQSLVEDKIISQSEFEQAKLAYENAKTAWDAVSGKSSASGTRVVSPIGGFVKNIAVGEGSFVEVGQTLATVSQNRRLVLRAEVSQKYLNDLRSVTSANFKTPYDNRLYSLSELGGRLLSVGKSSDGNSLFVPVTFEFNNSGDVIPGSFVEIYLLSAPVSDALTVPLSAVTEDQGVNHVYVQLDDEGYAKREVKLGQNDGQNVRVLSGLRAGETVVSRGVAQVKMASFSGAIPHGHSHSH